MFFKDINAEVRKQILTDLEAGIDHYEIKAKATATVIKLEPGTPEQEARNLVSCWFECLTFHDLPRVAEYA